MKINILLQVGMFHFNNRLLYCTPMQYVFFLYCLPGPGPFFHVFGVHLLALE